MLPILFQREDGEFQEARKTDEGMKWGSSWESEGEGDLKERESEVFFLGGGRNVCPKGVMVWANFY